jgi:hypothetical protein
MFDDGTDPLRSEGAVEAAKRALAEVGRKPVGRSTRRVQKLPKRELGANTRGLNPNSLVQVTVELPVSMVVASGSRLNQDVYEGLRDTLNKRGVQWFGPRFLRVMRAQEIKAAVRRNAFTP